MKAHLRNLFAIALTTFICFALTGIAGAAVFEIDQFSVTKNSNLIFDDQFDNGVAPPDAPDFLIRGTQTQYYINSGVTTGPETGGVYEIDPSKGAHITSSVTGKELLYQRYRLGTNVDQGQTLGLRNDDDLLIQGLFNFNEPGIKESYGIRLSDWWTWDTAGANDLVTLNLRKQGNGSMMVRFSQADFANGEFNTIESHTITGADFGTYEAILFELFTDAPDGGTTHDVMASFTLIDYEGTDLTIDFTAKGNIFNGEDFTRAGFYATTPVPVPSSILFLGAGITGLADFRRKKTA